MANAAPAGKPAEKTKTKRPSALKRNLQSQKRRLRNRSFQASVLTAIRGLEASLSQKQEATKVKENLSQVYSLLDKGVKKGIYKPNKAARTKSRLTARTAV